MDECLSDQLTESSVVCALNDITEWRKLGLQLEVPVRILNEIDDYPINQRKERLVIKWLQYDVNASWSKLASALEKMDCRRIAVNIRKLYIPGESVSYGTQLNLNGVLIFVHGLGTIVQYSLCIEVEWIDIAVSHSMKFCPNSS